MLLYNRGKNFVAITAMDNSPANFRAAAASR